MAGDVYAHPAHVGRGGWTWYTGSAGWMYRAGLESILGLRRHGSSFAIDPCIPASWPRLLDRLALGRTRYEITVSNPEHRCRGVARAALDGVAVRRGRHPARGRRRHAPGRDRAGREAARPHGIAPKEHGARLATLGPPVSTCGAAALRPGTRQRGRRAAYDRGMGRKGGDRRPRGLSPGRIRRRRASRTGRRTGCRAAGSPRTVRSSARQARSRRWNRRAHPARAVVRSAGTSLSEEPFRPDGPGALRDDRFEVAGAGGPSSARNASRACAVYFPFSIA